MKTATQVTGGLLSDSYGNATNNYLKGEKGGEIVGEAAKFFVETVSNIAPDVMFPDDYKINN